MNELFIERMKELLKDDFDAFINSLNENEVKGFYLNPLKKDVLNHLNHQYIEKHPYVDGGYYFDYLHYPLGKSPYFMCGLYYIQEPSAMSVASCLDIKENDYVLDMCGAPGGKTCYVASRLSNEGLMIANDISKINVRDYYKKDIIAIGKILLNCNTDELIDIAKYMYISKYRDKNYMNDNAYRLVKKINRNRNN